MWMPKSLHKTITFETVKLQKEEKDELVEMQIINEETAAKAIEKNMRRLEKKVEELKDEQTQIANTSAKFAWFLKNNTIAAYNDAMDVILDYHIKQAGTKEREKLKQIRSAYNTECEKLDAAIKNETSNMKSINERDVKDQIEKLYNMKHLGGMIRKIATGAEEAELEAVKEIEIIFREERKSSSKSTNLLQNLLTNWQI